MRRPGSSLPGGVRVLLEHTTTTPAVTILIALDAGSVHDPADLPGLAHFVSRTIDRGTSTRSAEQIAEDLDGWGVSLQTTVGRHTLSLGCTCLAGDFERVLSLLADVVRHPSFPEDEVETRRGHIHTLIRQEEDSPAAVATDTLLAMLYGHAHPYGRPLFGRVDTVARIDRAALTGFHGAVVTPAATCVVIVGDVDRRRASAAVERAFGDWVRAGRAGPPAALPADPVPITARQTRVMPMMGKSQTDIAYGLLGIRARPPRFLRLVADEHGARGVRDRRPARGQHPRAAGDGLLRVEFVGGWSHRRAPDGARWR